MTKYCEVCEKAIKHKGKYCSRACYNSVRCIRIDCICLYCGTVSVRRPSAVNKFCSDQCRGLYYSGERHPRWSRVTKTCEVCGRTFDVPECSEDRKYCSYKCYWVSKSTNARGDKNPRWVERVFRACTICGKLFECLVTSTQRFCSNRCRAKWQSKTYVGENHPSWETRIRVTCEVCGRMFETPPGTQKHRFCSKMCHLQWRKESYSLRWKGESNPNWSGGKPCAYPVEFNDALRRKVRERDGYTCAMCGLSGMDVHHIDYDKQNSDPANLVTLCRSCHITTNHNREHWEKELFELISTRESAREVYYGFYRYC